MPGTNRERTPRPFLWLLRVYPREFRERFAVDVCHTFRQRLERERKRGPLAVATFGVRTVASVTAHGLAERLRSIGGGLSTQPAGGSNDRATWRDRLSDLLRDLRLAVRSLRRRPGLAIASIGALGLGIGLTVTTFSIAWGTILKGLPFERSDQLIHFERENVEEGTPLAVTPHDYADWRTRQTSFEDLGAYVEALVHLTDHSGTVRRLWGAYIDPQSFDLLRVRPAIGRALAPEDAVPGAPDVVLLGHRLWSVEFGADSALVGRALDLNGEPATVIGVMPEGFAFPVSEQFWRPLRLDFGRLQRGEGRLDVFGRLAPGVDLARARTEFESLGSNLASAYPSTNRSVRPVLSTFQEEYVGPEFTRLVFAMLAGAVLVLLIACANVSNLLAARAMTRTRELAVRTALGASRFRVLSRFLAETAVIAGAGGLVGVGLARLGLDWFAAGARAGAFRLPHGSDSLFWWDLGISRGPLLFTFAITAVTALVAAAVPAGRALASDVGEVLKDEGRGGSSRRLSRLARVLVVGEIALTVALVVAAGLMVKSVLNATSERPGLSGDGVLTARVALPLSVLGLSEERYPNHEARLAFHESVLVELDARPGVVSSALLSTLPTSLGGGSSFELGGGGDGSADRETRVATVSPGFFETFSVPIIEGRPFAGSDAAGGEPVAIVNERFAERHFPGETPLFRQIRIRSEDDERREPWLTIIGVVPTLATHQDRGRDLSRVFVPLSQSGISPSTRVGRWGLRFMTVAVRSAGQAEGAAGILRDAVRSVDPTVPVYDVSPFDEVLDQASARYRIFGRYYLVFGLAGLGLSLIGLYSIMAFAVNTRRSEIGIRMALGARRGDVTRQVLGEGGRQIVLGLALGSVLAVWITSGLSSVLYQVDRWDPWIAGATVVLLLTTGLLACAIPARRAASVNPTEALRPD